MPTDEPSPQIAIPGAGSGYEAALSAMLGRSVLALEEDRELARRARAALVAHAIASVSIVEVEGEHRPRVVAVGWNPHPGWLKPPTPESEKPNVEGQQEGEQKA